MRCSVFMAMIAFFQQDQFFWRWCEKSWCRWKVPVRFKCLDRSHWRPSTGPLDILFVQLGAVMAECAMLMKQVLLCFLI